MARTNGFEVSHDAFFFGAISQPGREGSDVRATGQDDGVPGLIEGTDEGTGVWIEPDLAAILG